MPVLKSRDDPTVLPADLVQKEPGAIYRIPLHLHSGTCIWVDRKKELTVPDCSWGAWVDVKIIPAT